MAPIAGGVAVSTERIGTVAGVLVPVVAVGANLLATALFPTLTYTGGAVFGVTALALAGVGLLPLGTRLYVPMAVAFLLLLACRCGRSAPAPSTRATAGWGR